jgi:hypothetical protein
MTRAERIMMTTGERKFCNAMEKIIHKLKAEIEKKNTILIPAKDLAREMEPKFEIKSISRFYFLVKICLRANDIHVEPKTKDYEPALLMRARTQEDVW